MKLYYVLLTILLSANPIFAENLSNDSMEFQSFKKKKKKKKHKKKKSKECKDNKKKGDKKKNKDANTTPNGSWSGPSWKSATNLSHLGNFKKNLSGAHWNSESQKLYTVVNNPASIYELSLENGDFVQSKKISASGDFEGITMIPNDTSKVYVMGEECECIIEFDLSTEKKTKAWHLPSLGSSSGGQGPEGITFIADEFLDASIGKSQLGMGGLFVVSHQNGGDIYFYDVEKNGRKSKLVKSLATRASESSGLEFDSSEAKLYIWHNVGSNSIEIVKPAIAEDGKLELIKHIDGPKTGNIEGIAVGRVADGEHYLFFTDDDNQDSYALFWYDSLTL